MQAQHPSGSGAKATTAPRHLLVTATSIVGEALVRYQVQKTAEARIRLESVADMAHRLGELSPADAAVITKLLAQPCAAPRAAAPTLN
ncbi:hypothetical protein [Stutzerimonas kunmingensis]|uniref:hypothetical protein n=1 Tax=Stutzerimonas kunmingensis TaxID=1211807 RepID=UPI00241CB1FA|nr:hypothetical protein [Stutzerimonas kunmingensis]